MKHLGRIVNFPKRWDNELQDRTGPWWKCDIEVQIVLSYFIFLFQLAEFQMS